MTETLATKNYHGYTLTIKNPKSVEDINGIDEFHRYSATLEFASEGVDGTIRYNLPKSNPTSLSSWLITNKTIYAMLGEGAIDLEKVEEAQDYCGWTLTVLNSRLLFSELLVDELSGYTAVLRPHKSRKHNVYYFDSSEEYLRPWSISKEQIKRLEKLGVIKLARNIKNLSSQ